MYIKLVCMIVSIYSGVLIASDNHTPLYITLPAQSCTPGHTFIEQIDINRVHRGDSKTLKELIQESAEDNKPIFPIVAYWYKSGTRFCRAYGSYKAFKELRNENVTTILGQSYYYVRFVSPQEYLVIRCDEEPV